MKNLGAINLLFIRLQKLATITRSNEWWASKGSPVLATAYATASILNIPLVSLWNSLIFLLISLTVVAIYAHLLNDISDQDEDLIVGKSNGLAGRSKSFKGIAIILCLFPGLLVIGCLIKLPLALAIYISNWLIFICYSIPPIRLKQRGFLGVLADATGAHLLPNLFAVVWIAHASEQKIPLLWIILVGIWSLATGLRGILWHQIKDIENDRLTGVNTFAVQTSIKTLKGLGQWVVFPLEVIAFTGMVIICGNYLLIIFLLIHLVTQWLRYHFWQINSIIVAPVSSDSMLLEEYYALFYPLAFLVSAAWQNPLNLIFSGIHLILYPNHLRWWLRDIHGLLRWEIPNYFSKFQKS
ncbi:MULTISPECIES: UbiA family prenyltransferase [Aphanizomenonaceae]|jgi:4-hydroxybenzoate polyprenyltransferase|uniref:UbiA family prenyltransferase n=1 Tax=Dolichospermum heterosporum TAC447 TaxID=747523 RepID=A0ABY5M4Q7_9CYAN|nr:MULTISPECIES: UbiA family prenyltransferase [Aphanizomenonaceae]MBE9257027.1 UbiA family prenyltransferase [Dolichospermum sp. LEGE 00246]MDK2409349.1 UbiA family prenyltransferase [Aphanizomenon sp. 202]MDK2458798.1 UbiA family prenyltransferase [Aphanizomenon sp. PH219]UUO17820.1 UbiA family prenyltransferase [Dolichospermum heterosporum TAC447]